MTSDVRLAELELLVLAAIMRIGPLSYGVPIRAEIEMTLGRAISSGTLYKTLRRLEGKGFVRSSVSAPTPVRGGRAKTHYQVEPAGAMAVRASVRDLGKMLRGLDVGWGTP